MKWLKYFNWKWAIFGYCGGWVAQTFMDEGFTESLIAVLLLVACWYAGDSLGRYVFLRETGRRS